jgi:hypothetical protein
MQLECGPQEVSVKDLRSSWRPFWLVLILTSVCGVSHASHQLPDGLILERPTLSLGRVVVGSRTVVNELILNPTSSDIRIASASLDSADFQISGVSFPLVIAAGQTASIGIGFSPAAIGRFSSSLVLSINGDDPYVSIPISATAIGPGQLTASPLIINFAAGTGGQQIAETITNTGGTFVTIHSATTSGSGFTVSTPPLPIVLRPNQSTTLTLSIRPGMRNATGSVNLTARVAQWAGGERGDYQNALATATRTMLVIPVSSVTAMGQLTPAPSSLSFGSAQVGSMQTQSATLTNSGNGPVTVAQAAASGTGFGISGLPLPMTLNPGESATFSAVFTPQSTGSVQGSISIVSNASNSTVNLALSGSGTSSGQLILSPASLNFGSVPVGKNQSMSATLAASGSSVTISSASASTPEFSLSGIQLPITIPAGKAASFTVTFAPQASGTSSASIAFGSNASQSTTVESVSGAGSAPASHSVGLSWSPGGSNVSGYNVYRGSQSGGPYAKINSAPTALTSYGDGAVNSGQTYFYVTTALDGGGAESSNSNEVQAVIP